VTEILRAKMHAGRLRVAVTNEELGGDPIVGIPKTLEVSYAVGAKVYDKSAPEGGTFSIP
jgi:hypothetical protein